MIKSDFHVHSELSTDSDAPFEYMIKGAMENNISHLCFTEHMDIDFPSTLGYTSAEGELEYQVDMDKYSETFCTYKEKYDSLINLYFGIELGLMPDITDKLTQFVKDNVFDFIIGSVHIVDNIDVYEEKYFDGYDEKERYRHYFEVTLENIKKYNDFDVLGHLDYISRCGKKCHEYDYKLYADVIDEILKTLISNGNGIEINTSPYKKGLSRPNPCREIVCRYHELGGEIITIGSDAHTPKYIASHFPAAELILRTAGYKHYNIFKKRKLITIDL